MKSTKRIICMVVALSFALALLPAAASAQEGGTGITVVHEYYRYNLNNMAAATEARELTHEEISAFESENIDTARLRVPVNDATSYSYNSTVVTRKLHVGMSQDPQLMMLEDQINAATQDLLEALGVDGEALDALMEQYPARGQVVRALAGMEPDAPGRQLLEALRDNYDDVETLRELRRLYADMLENGVPSDRWADNATTNTVFDYNPEWYGSYQVTIRYLYAPASSGRDSGGGTDGKVDVRTVQPATAGGTVSIDEEELPLSQQPLADGPDQELPNTGGAPSYPLAAVGTGLLALGIFLLHEEKK